MPHPTAHARTLEQVIGATTGRFSVCAKELASSSTLALNADEIMPTASCIKLFILIELARRIHAQELQASDVIALTPADHVGGSGVLKFMAHDAHVSLEDAAMFMMALSDNTATNVLIDTLGLEAINATARDIGCAHTCLHNRVDFQAIGTDVRNFATSTASDFVKALERIATDQLFSPTASRFVLRILSTQQHLDLLPRYLDYNQYAQDLSLPQEITVANKTGFFPGFRGDVAIMRAASRTIVIAAFAEGLDDLTLQVEHAGAQALGRVGRFVVDTFCAASCVRST